MNSDKKLETNSAGYTRADYQGGASTLCIGCGHSSTVMAIVEACFEMALEPHKMVKISGIGCSSKTPAYFLGKSHGFNTVHGRMPAVATGANMANRDLLYIGVSGDGDTASIGMGQFAHALRHNLNLNYLCMNNGCYGLTKGQDSATADKGSKSKKGKPNLFNSIDLCSLAIELGASYVARASPLTTTLHQPKATPTSKSTQKPTTPLIMCLFSRRLQQIIKKVAPRR